MLTILEKVKSDICFMLQRYDVFLKMKKILGDFWQNKHLGPAITARPKLFKLNYQP